MRYTLGQAARATGKGKTTIQRAILSGKLSAIRNDDGSYSIDPAELARVFPLLHLDRPATVPMERSATPDETAVELATLRERVAQLEDRLKDTETVRDRLLEQNERLTLLLGAPGETPAPVAPAEQPTEMPVQPSARAWWRRLVGE